MVFWFVMTVAYNCYYLIYVKMIVLLVKIYDYILVLPSAKKLDHLN